MLRGTGTAATLFWGEPSITRSEYVRYTSVLRLLSTMRTTRRRLKSSEVRSVNTSYCCLIGPAKLIAPVAWQLMEASDLSSASPSAPLTPPVLARET